MAGRRSTVGAGLAVWAYSAQAKGYLAKDPGRLAESVVATYDTPANRRTREAVGAVAHELGVAPASVVVAGVRALTPEHDVLPVVGCSSVTQVDEAAAGADLDLPAELASRLRELWAAGWRAGRPAYPGVAQE